MSSIQGLRWGDELIQHRGDVKQAQTLDAWLLSVIEDYNVNILSFSEAETQISGRLSVLC